MLIELSYRKIQPLRVVAFDWGGTLMEELPYTGAMVDWPRVAGVSGALEGLQALQARGLRLVVATNAADSDANQVRSALARVGMDGFISQVYTSARLGGARKPMPEYFAGLCAAEGILPEQVVMVGDNLAVDVRGAAACGLRTIWYNPTGKGCTGLDIVQDAELGLGEMAEVSLAVDSLSLPDLQQIDDWMDAVALPENIRVHARLVGAAAYHMAARLKAQGQRVNPVLAYRGGLLHDLAKMLVHGREEKQDHGQAAAQMLAAAGQPALAEIALRHMLFSLVEEERAPRTWEEKLVYFADKLIERRKLVSVEERLRSLQERYSIGCSDLGILLPALNQMQADLCRQLDLPPGELIAWLEMAMFPKE